MVLGDVISRFAPFFRMYSTYVNNHEAASQFLGRILKSRPKKYERFIQLIEGSTWAIAVGRVSQGVIIMCTMRFAENAQNPACKGQSLQSFFILPIQRIPRYKLLVEELLKHTPITHPDHSTLSEALKVSERLPCAPVYGS